MPTPFHVLNPVLQKWTRSTPRFSQTGSAIWPLVLIGWRLRLCGECERDKAWLRNANDLRFIRKNGKVAISLRFSTLGQTELVMRIAWAVVGQLVGPHLPVASCPYLPPGSFCPSCLLGCFFLTTTTSTSYCRHG